MPLELLDTQRRIMRRRRFGSTIIQPPYDQVHNIWAFDPDQIGAAQYQVGPTGTVTTPVRTGGTPSFYTFGASDYIDFGDALDSTWSSSTAGFTIYACIKPSAGDLTTANAAIVHKNDNASAQEIQLLLSTNTLYFYTMYAGGTTNYTSYPSSASVLTAATRYVIAVTYDPTQPRSGRTNLYRNGTFVGGGATPVGSDGTIADTASTLRIGNRIGLTNPVSTISYTYAYSGAHSAGTVSSITSWLQNTKGWV